MTGEECRKFLSDPPTCLSRSSGILSNVDQVRLMFLDEPEVEAMDDWSVHTVFSWLQDQHFLGDAKQTFATSAKVEQVDGSMLKLLDGPTMEEMGIASVKLRLKLMTHIIRVNTLAQQIQKEDRALQAETLAQQVEKAQHIEKLCEIFFISTTQSTQEAMKNE